MGWGGSYRGGVRWVIQGWGLCEVGWVMLGWVGSSRGQVGHTGVGWGGSWSEITQKMIVLKIKILPDQNHFWKVYKILILNKKILLFLF